MKHFHRPFVQYHIKKHNGGKSRKKQGTTIYRRIV